MRLVNDNRLRDIVIARLKELDWSDNDLIKDAEERGMKIDNSRWSKYKKNKTGQITDDVLAWICCRLYIPININYGKPVLKEGKLNYEIPKYNELEALKLINQAFPKSGKEK